VLSETTGTNTTRYVHGPRGIHAQKDSAGNWEHMLQDGLGSVRGVVDTNANVLWSANLDGYGNPFSTVGTTQTNYGFTGEYGLPGGLVHLRARNYHPGLGVFTALDPFEGMAGRPMSLNGYGWVEGNTPNAVDPSGMSPFGIAIPGLTGLIAACLANPVCLVGLAVGGAIALAWWLNQGAQTCADAIQNIGYTIQETADAIQDILNPPVVPPWYPPPISIPRPGNGPISLPVNPPIDNPDDRVNDLDRVIPIPGEPDDDDCPDDTHKIQWPEPVWVLAQHGDTNALTGQYDYPPKIIVKQISPVRDTTWISYRDLNIKSYNNLGGSLNIRIHHKWPLFLGGPDTTDNLVFMTIAEHTTWHTALYGQGVTGYMPRDPNGTRYCISRGAI
jgi:RHS repeat-associated protein